MMPLTVQEVPIEFVNVVWPSVEGFIASAIEHANGDLTLDETKINCAHGHWHLLVAVDENNVVQGAATLYYFNRINDRVAFITTIGGKGIFTRELFSQFSDILKLRGATCVEGAVRDSLVRFTARLGAKKKTTTVYIPL